MNQIEMLYTSPETATTKPGTSERKRTHSTLSERRYRDSSCSNSMLEEVDMFTSNEGKDKFSVASIGNGVGTAEVRGAGKLLNYKLDVKHEKAPSALIQPQVPPNNYHTRHRSCH
jgi:hypothetical protein